MINTHITTFAGVPNLNIPLTPTTQISTIYSELQARLALPEHNAFILTTTSGRLLHPSSHDPISSLASCDLLTLRLSHPLCGGKGGFGSQLRAAGGRMSSRKKSQENSDSCRNLDGRRMRTVKEAKALAAWLEVKPEMEKREKEIRLKRWRDIVEAAEKREDGAGNKRFDDHAWIEALEEGKERTREAVMGALREAGLLHDCDEEEAESSGESSGGEGSASGIKRAMDMAKAEGKKKVVERKFAGWDDEDDEFMSSDEEMEDVAEEEGEDEDEMEDEDEEQVGVKGKGKAKAVA